jgi:hypothetical protein
MTKAQQEARARGIERVRELAGGYHIDLQSNRTSEKLPTIATVKSVSRSGMSRTVKIGVLINDSVLNITESVANVFGQTTNDSGLLRVTGAGMDMLFHTIYRFNQEALYHDLKQGKITPDEFDRLKPRAGYDYLLDSNYKTI